MLGEANTLEEFSIGDPRGGEEAVVTLHQVVLGEDLVEVVAKSQGVAALLIVSRGESSLEFSAERLERGRSDHAFGRPADAEEDVGA